MSWEGEYVPVDPIYLCSLLFTSGFFVPVPSTEILNQQVIALVTYGIDLLDGTYASVEIEGLGLVKKDSDEQ